MNERPKDIHGNEIIMGDWYWCRDRRGAICGVGKFACNIGSTDYTFFINGVGYSPESADYARAELPSFSKEPIDEITQLHSSLEKAEAAGAARDIVLSELLTYLYTVNDDTAVGFSCPMPVEVLEEAQRDLSSNPGSTILSERDRLREENAKLRLAIACNFGPDELLRESPVEELCAACADDGQKLWESQLEAVELREALQQAEKLIMSNVDPFIDGPALSDTFTQAASVVVPMIRAALSPQGEVWANRPTRKS